MALYHYKAAAASGEVVEGQQEAPDEETLIRQLQDAGQIPIRIRAASGLSARGTLFGPRRVSPKQILAFTQELATLLGAGLPLDRSLQILEELADDPRIAQLTSRILTAVQGGAPLSDALEAQTGTFSRLYVNMVRAGELGGSLDVVLRRLTDYLQRARELRDTVISALIYPSILVLVSILSVIILLVFVVPHFTQLFADAGKALPLATQIVIASGDFLRAYGWVLALVVVALVFYFRWLFADPARRVGWDRLALKLPLVGDLIGKLEFARFSRTLGTLLGNGVPLLAAFAIVKETLNNRVLADGLETAVAGLKEGQSLSEPLLASGLFPKLGLQMVKVGEETGQLEAMLLEVAETYDREVKTAVQRLLALLEPLLIVGLGVLIAGIIMSILVAIVSVNELAF